MTMQIADMLAQVARPADPRPKLEAEMVEMARKVIVDALLPENAPILGLDVQVELAKWVVLNFWTPDS